MNIVRCFAQTLQRYVLGKAGLVVCFLLGIVLVWLLAYSVSNIAIPTEARFSSHQFAFASQTFSVLFISPEGRGTRDGKTVADAGTLDDLPTFITKVGPGGEVRILNGVYSHDGKIRITSGGNPKYPVTIRGADESGNETEMPVIVGRRSSPYRPPPNGQSGSSLFNLLPGANHLIFRNIHCRNQGNGCFVFAGTTGDVTLEQLKGTNVQRFVEHQPDSTEPNAWDLSNVVIRTTEIRGYSKGAIRFGKPQPDGKSDAHDLLIEDVMGDSERQDHDNFCMGVHLRGDVRDVILRRTVMSNCQQTRSADDYWNGDGFAAEASVSHLLFEDTRATGNTDGGYDIKAQTTVMIRPYAADNKRNFRVWSAIAIHNAIGEEPRCRGGIGCQVQVHATHGADATLTDCTFTSTNPSTYVFKSESGGKITVTGGTVQHNGILSVAEGHQKVIVLSGVMVNHQRLTN